MAHRCRERAPSTTSIADLMHCSELPARDYWAAAHHTVCRRQQRRSVDYAACLNDKLTGERKSNGLSRNKVYVENKRCGKLDR